jgi:DNA modification methylase
VEVQEPMIYYQDGHVSLYNADCRSMSELADESIQCIVTSPPYWGLRKYAGLPDSVWGGDKNCGHSWQLNKNKLNGGGYSDKSTLAGFTSPDTKGRAMNGGIQQTTNTCLTCGAWKGQLGLEPTIDLYVAHLMEILRECKRVLRSDGTMWLNCGDSYAGGKGQSGQPMSAIDQEARAQRGESINRACGQLEVATRPSDSLSGLRSCNVKPKDLCLIPFRVALAAQADGWWIRSDIIWSKPNPMPESVTDRPTDAYEHIFLMTKSARYYYDNEAVREPYTEPLNRWGGNDVRNSSHKYIDTFEQGEDNGGIGAIGKSSMLRAGALTRPDENGRNLRNVWTINTQPYKEAHFATFPQRIPELCIKAGTPEYGCCDKCGTPYERMIERKPENRTRLAGEGQDSAIGTAGRAGELETKTLGWRQACKCADAKPVPATVLDPFAGSGTSAWVAKKLNRKCVLYEGSEKYCKLIVKRNSQQVGL